MTPSAGFSPIVFAVQPRLSFDTSCEAIPKGTAKLPKEIREMMRISVAVVVLLANLLLIRSLSVADEVTAGEKLLQLVVTHPGILGFLVVVDQVFPRRIHVFVRGQNCDQSAQ